MAYRDEWDQPDRTGTLQEAWAGLGALRLALLFGAGAIALAMVVTPVLDRQTRQHAASTMGSGDVDFITTGGVGPRGGGQTYTIRRSVLQSSPDSVCIIRSNGMRSGDC